MSDTVYTPWDFESDETSTGQAFSVYDRCGDRISGPYVTEGQARLIAAAPELFEAAKEVAIRMPLWLEGLEEDHPAVVALNALSTALAKAEPRS